MSVLDLAHKLQVMLSKNHLLEALEQFYHEDVEVLEVPTGERRIGKSAQKESLLHFLGMVETVHKRGLYSLCINDDQNITTAETWMEVTFKDGEHYIMEEVAIQHWENELIVEEKFYYSLPE